MASDLRDMLERQAAWQRTRANRPWAEKLRLAVAMRRAIETLRKTPWSATYRADAEEAEQVNRDGEPADAALPE